MSLRPPQEYQTILTNILNNTDNYYEKSVSGLPLLKSSRRLLISAHLLSV